MQIIVIFLIVLVLTGLTVWLCLSGKKSEPEEELEATEPVTADKPLEPVIPEDQEPVVTVEPHEPLIQEPAAEPEVPDTLEKPSEPESVPQYEEGFQQYLQAFRNYVSVGSDTKVYRHLYDLYREAMCQYLENRSVNGIPVLYTQKNYPTLYEFGNEGNQKQAIGTLIGWLFALQLSELKPYYRTEILKIGYELGGLDRYSNIYGYGFMYDPNLLRIFAAAIYAAMRGMLNPDIETMREEVGGRRYDKSLKELSSGSKDMVKPENFFVDFREFMPTAPGPYAPDYGTRPDNTYPTEGRDKYDNLQTDRNIHEMIVEMYNLNIVEHYQETVQAIADKEADREHLFGPNRSTCHYMFHPVFGEDTIGLELPDSGILAELASQALKASSNSRGILQSTTTSPKQYGRLRPGCSWKQEARKNSSVDDRRNILTNFEIEDGDGSPTGYYDSKGNWVYKDTVRSPEEFEEQSKNALWANSYPSGHSSGIMGAAMVLIELMPERSDRILKAANQYAVNRTIARYHWTSDTINGRVLGSATNAIAHASVDYDELIDKARQELKTILKGS